MIYEVTANPYVITFEEDAEGGPHHFLANLVSYYVKLLNDGNLLAEGTIIEVSDETVVIMDEPSGTVFSFNYWTEIDEVRYC